MAIVLGLITALFFGSGDFFGGVAAKRTAVLHVVGLSHLVGLISISILAPLVADDFTWNAIWLGMIAGAIGGMGVALLYRGLARGPMVVVAPLTAITSAAVPAVWGVVDGETFSGSSWLGIFLALLAIVLTSVPGNANAGTTDQAPVTVRIVAESLIAGTCFGAMFVVYDITADATAPWPVVGARLLTAGVLVTIIVTTRRGNLSTAYATRWPIILTGLFDTGSNAVFLYATTLGDITIVSVLSALYPAATVVLALVVLDERISRLQLAGLVTALTATVLIATG